MYEESIEKESQNIEEFYFPSKFYFRSVPPKIRRNEANSIRSNTILKSARTPTLSLSLSLSVSLSKTFLLFLSLVSLIQRGYRAVSSQRKNETDGEIEVLVLFCFVF